MNKSLRLRVYEKYNPHPWIRAPGRSLGVESSLSDLDLTLQLMIANPGSGCPGALIINSKQRDFQIEFVQINVGL